MTIWHSLKIWRPALKGLTMAHYSHLLCWPNGQGDIPQYRLFITGIWEKNSIKSYCTLCWPVFRWTFIWNGKPITKGHNFLTKLWSQSEATCKLSVICIVGAVNCLSKQHIFGNEFVSFVILSRYVKKNNYRK